MNSETKTCQNCKKDFVIEPDDFSFYEKIKVLPPTFCSECRRQRRLAWYNLVNLFHRNCDLCGERFISMYPKEAPYVIYCPKCWWSDNWDWRDYGRDYDFNRPFFEQFEELSHQVPLLGLSINLPTAINSSYTNHSGNLKDCNLIFEGDFNQESAFGVFLVRNRESFNSSAVMDCDTVYDCMNLYKSHHTVGTRGNIRFCINCYFVRDCENCQDCFMCANLKNKKYCYKNEQYSKEEYEDIIKSYNLYTHSGYQKAKKEADDFWKTVSPKPSWDTMSVNCRGSYIFQSKNCHECYDVTDTEDCKYMMMMHTKTTKNCYDILCWGYFLENSYECCEAGEYSSNILFSIVSGVNSMNIEYCNLALGGQNQFGCVSARNGENVIFNKTYSKEEYSELREKVIKHMDEMPYIDKKENVYRYGEFFPHEFSPFPYNITLANLFNPLNQEEIESFGSYYIRENKNEYQITRETKDILDDINDVDDSILNEVIRCEKCGTGYKVIEMELNFLRKMNLPLPHECPFCRINEKLNIWVDNMKLKDRICNKCDINFKTHWSVERAPIIYCNDCYKQEFY